MHTPPQLGGAESSPDWKRQCPHTPPVITIPAQPLFPIAPHGGTFSPASWPDSPVIVWILIVWIHSALCHCCRRSEMFKCLPMFKTL